MLSFEIYDQDILQKLSQYADTEENQQQVALYAMRLGLEAIAVIRGEMDKEALQNVGEDILAQMQDRMEAVLEADHDSIIATVREEITKLEERRSIQRRVTLGGNVFEDDLGDALQLMAQQAKDTFQSTGTLTGKDGKTGDFLIVLGNECHAPGERIVVEAKRKKGVTLENILSECKDARINREAQVCIFVWDKESSGRVPPLRRYENDIVVLWDAVDPAMDIYLDAAYWLARSLVIPRLGEPITGKDRRERLAGNFDEIMQQIDILDTVRLSGEHIRQEGAAIKKNCTSILQVLQDKLKEMKLDIEALTEQT